MAIENIETVKNKTPRMILLVDDNPIQLTSRKAILSRSGFNVTTADSPQRALEIVSQSLPRIDLVVTDHMMPGMDGVEFVTELRKSAAELPVLVISGLPNVEDQYDGLNVYSLQKPCPPEMLIARVTSLTDQQLPRTA